MHALRLAPVLVLAASVAACGDSAADRQVDDLERACNALNGSGKTIGQAAADFDPIYNGNPAFIGGSSCSPDAIPGSACTPTAQDPACAYFFEFLTPGSCGQNGCCQFCEVRVLQSTAGAIASAPVCAAEFFRNQPCQ